MRRRRHILDLKLKWNANIEGASPTIKSCVWPANRAQSYKTFAAVIFTFALTSWRVRHLKTVPLKSNIFECDKNLPVWSN